MGRFGTFLAGCALLMLLCAPLNAEGEPVVKAWRHFLVVTAAGGELTPEDVATRKQLETFRVSFSFQDTPFADAVEYLGAVSGLNVVIHKDADVGDANLTLTLKDVKLRTALEFVTRQANVTWTIRDGVVVIGHKDDVVAPRTTRVYDVMHLLAPPPDFEGPGISMSLSRSDRQPDNQPVWPVPEPTKVESGKSRQELMEELVEIVGDLLKADTWEASSFP